MQIPYSVFIFSLCILGFIFGSFSTVLIERWKSKKSGIFLGRSECPKCNHILNWKDLFPIFSYMTSQGKCRYCGTGIPLFYPITESLFAILFVIMGTAGIKLGFEIFSYEMLLLLILGFITGIYIMYDIRYMEIPDQIMVPGIYLLVFLSILEFYYTGIHFHTFPISIEQRLYGALIFYTFFYLQIFIPGSFFLLRNKKWKESAYLLAYYFIFPIDIILGLFRKDESNIEIPTWIGGGDLRIAIFIGLTLGTLHGGIAMGIAYVLGSIWGVSYLFYKKIRNQSSQSELAFGPFLGIGWILSVFFFTEISNYLNTYL